MSLPLSGEPTLWNFFYRQWAETKLLEAAEKGYLENVKYYLSQGCNINTRSFPVAEGYTPLVYETINDRHEVVKYLLQNNAYTNTCEGCSLVIATRNKTIRTLFTILLWSNPESCEKEEALAVTDEFDGGFVLKPMIANFEQYVNNNKHNLPSDLSKQIEEYVQKTPPFKDNKISIGCETVGVYRSYAYKFNKRSENLGSLLPSWIAL